MARQPDGRPGRFFNPDYPFIPALSDHIRWSLTPNPKRAEKRRDVWRVPVVRDERFLKHEAEDVLIWLGHASFFLRMSGVSMLIDPMFGGFPGISRRSEMPFQLPELGNIDLGLISHNHRDHCDQASLCAIAQHSPKVRFLTGLGTDMLLRKWVKNISVQGAGWYQKFETGHPELEIYFLPARHWTRRWIFDTNQHLWGAFLIRTPEHTLYFSGDTGYGRHFAETAQLFPDIDTAIIGVGTYQPAFESPMHINPEEAVRGFRELRAKKLIPMHYGTFDLSHEPFGEPLRRIRACARVADLQVLAVGENYFLPTLRPKTASVRIAKEATASFHSN